MIADYDTALASNNHLKCYVVQQVQGQQAWSYLKGQDVME